MDPVANIKEQRELAREIQEECDKGPGHRWNGVIVEKAERLAELVLALDEWRSRGGFDPYPVAE